MEDERHTDYQKQIKFTSKCLVEVPRRINVDDQNAFEERSEDEQVVDPGLSDGHTLLVRLPGMSRISVAIGCVNSCCVEVSE